MKLKRFGILSCGILGGILYGVMGLVFGAIVSMVALMGAAFGGVGETEFAGVLFGVGAIFLLPIFYGLLGFLGSLLTAWLYNLIASWTGGIEIEFDSSMPSPSTGQAPLGG